MAYVNQWPFGDKVVGKLWDALERGVYEALRADEAAGDKRSSDSYMASSFDCMYFYELMTTAKSVLSS